MDNSPFEGEGEKEESHLREEKSPLQRERERT